MLVIINLSGITYSLVMKFNIRHTELIILLYVISKFTFGIVFFVQNVPGM